MRFVFFLFARHTQQVHTVHRGTYFLAVNNSKIKQLLNAESHISICSITKPYCITFALCGFINRLLQLILTFDIRVTGLTFVHFSINILRYMMVVFTSVMTMLPLAFHEVLPKLKKKYRVTTHQKRCQLPKYIFARGQRVTSSMSSLCVIHVCTKNLMVRLLNEREKTHTHVFYDRQCQITCFFLLFWFILFSRIMWSMCVWVLVCSFHQHHLVICRVLFV